MITSKCSNNNHLLIHWTLKVFFYIEWRMCVPPPPLLRMWLFVFTGSAFSFVSYPIFYKNSAATRSVSLCIFRNIFTCFSIIILKEFWRSFYLTTWNCPFNYRNFSPFSSALSRKTTNSWHRPLKEFHILIHHRWTGDVCLTCADGVIEKTASQPVTFTEKHQTKP